MTKVIVDSACGYGRSFRYLAETHKDSVLVGYDSNRSCLYKARKAASILGIQVGLIQASHTGIPLKESSIDLFYQFNPEPLLPTGDYGSKLSKELVRILKPNGKFILTSDSPQPEKIIDLIKSQVENQNLKYRETRIEEANMRYDMLLYRYWIVFERML